MKRALIIGGGPAGLTAAYELLKGSKAKNPPEEIEVIVLEESGLLGGISKTVNYNGNRMDMGGHRFFSKDPKVNAWWKEMLPPQGAPAYDDIVLHRTPPLAAGGPDPEKCDRVMLTRNRVSRIYFDKKFFDYPISLKWETFKNMGFLTTMQAGFSYLASVLHKRQENSLEDFYINRFGRKLYSMFFENIRRTCGAGARGKLLPTGARSVPRGFLSWRLWWICSAKFSPVRKTAMWKLP